MQLSWMECFTLLSANSIPQGVNPTLDSARGKVRREMQLLEKMYHGGYFCVCLNGVQRDCPFHGVEPRAVVH